MGIQMLFRVLICVSKVLLFCKWFFVVFFFSLKGRASALVVINLCKIYQILEVKKAIWSFLLICIYDICYLFLDHLLFSKHLSSLKLSGEIFSKI